MVAMMRIEALLDLTDDVDLLDLDPLPPQAESSSGRAVISLSPARGAATPPATIEPAEDRLPTHETILVSAGGNQSPSFLRAKRLVDIVGSLLALAVLSPLLATTWAVLWVTTKGQPFYCGMREGLCGRKYRMYKFRTMRIDADRVQHLVQNERGGAMFKNKTDPRITRVGRFLRAFSIDELPQLLNVLLGDMSLVGPRPMVPAQDNVYRAWQLRRLAVKPGITGLWQVSGRSEIGFAAEDPTGGAQRQGGLRVRWPFVIPAQGVSRRPQGPGRASGVFFEGAVCAARASGSVRPIQGSCRV
jgi:lipopolysaccharide/colanic/teichoic acid biosynthesis glycosyltransferase